MDQKDWWVQKLYWGTVLKPEQKIRRNMWKFTRKVLETNWITIHNWTKKQSKTIEELESDKIMLQNQILEIKKQNLQNQQEIEELD